MKEYTFEELNDIEFERFVNDLFSREYSWKIERYKPGKDGGSDGKVLLAQGNIIIQTKHYRKSGLSQLIANIKNEELAKAVKLKAYRYILVTSLPLNINDKRVIMSAYGNLGLNEEDIYGNNDINAILRKHPDILISYYKLWAENSATLELFLHPEIQSKEIALKSRLNRIIKIFVETEDFDQSIKSLNENHVVVLSGEPGVGKTTLAEYLCYIHMKNNYSVHIIEGSMENYTYNFADRDKKVLYYFDDFLGSNYFNAITGNQDSAIINFINQIRIEPNKRFILTSRTNIIQKAHLFSQQFRNYGLSTKQYIIQTSNYSKLTKAKILYSHLWNSDIDEELKMQIINDSFYQRIINHRNFNPRLISFTLSVDGIEGIDICESIIKHLENPEQIWDQCYIAQIDEQARIMMKLCVANGGRIIEPVLEESYNKALSIYGFIPTSNQPVDFQHTSKLVCNCLLNKFIDSDDTFYTPYNPSVTDYIIGKISTFIEASKLIKSLNTDMVITFYHDLILANKIKKDESDKIAEYLLEYYGSYLSKRFYIVLHLALWLDNETELLIQTLRVFNSISFENYKFSDVNPNMLSNIIILGKHYGVNDDVLQFLLDTEPFDHDNLLELYNAIFENNKTDLFLSVIKEKIVESLSNIAEDYVKDDSSLSECRDEQDIEILLDNNIQEMTDKYFMLNDVDLQLIRSSISVETLYNKIWDMNEYEKGYVQIPDRYQNTIHELTENEEIKRMFENYNK